MNRRLRDYFGRMFFLHRIYWHLRERAKNIQLRVRKLGFALEEKGTDTRVETQILASLFRSVIGSLGVGFVAVTLVMIVGSHLGEVSLGDRSIYDGLLTAVATVVGVFLTLYLTSTNTVAGTIYARMPKNVRALFARDRVGGAYVSFLIFLTILSIGLLVGSVATDYRPRFALYVVGILGSVGVLAFVQLSRRAFLFYDPTYLSDVLFGDFLTLMRQVSAGSRVWDAPPFQDYCRRKAHQSLSGLAALVEVAQEEPHLKRGPLSNLLAKIPILLSAYLRIRPRIPHSSLWYEQVPSHKEWYLTSDHAVQLATSTQTGLLPEMKPDQQWIERALLDLLVSSLRSALDDGRIEIAIGILQDLNSAFQSLGEAWAVEYGMELLNEVSLTTIAKINELNVSAAGAKERLALVEYVGLVPISLLLGFYQSVREMDPERLLASISRVDWQDRMAIYTIGLPLVAVERLEFIRERIGLEIVAEGLTISPVWYIAHILIQPIALALEQQVRRLGEIGQKHYLRVARQFITDGKYLDAATFLARSLEYHNKSLVHLPSARKLAESLERAKSLVELQWPSWDWEGVEKALLESQKELFISLGQCIPGLSKTTPSLELPDYLGAAVHNSGEQCYEALKGNDAQLFKQLFPYYLEGILSIYTRLSERTRDWQQDSILVAVSEPLLDLVELSGYAKLYSELHEEPALWVACKEVWEKYLKGVDPARVVPYLGALISYNQHLFAITPRSTLRTSWGIKFEQCLRSLPRRPLRDEWAGSGIAWQDRTVVQHPSRLIQLMAGTSEEYMAFYDGTDVFVEFFLTSLPEGKDVDFGTGGRLADALSRWHDGGMPEEPEGGSLKAEGEVP